MLEVYEPGASIIEDSVANAVERVDKTNKRVLDFIFGVQTAMLDEVIFVSNEILDRVPFGQGPEGDVRGMRPAPDRLCPPRQRAVVQAWRANDRSHVGALQ
jgi:hypothetical protein